MKIMLFVLALFYGGLSFSSTQANTLKTFQKEQATLIIIKPSKSNTKQTVAKALSLLLGLNFGLSMKQLSQGIPIVVTLKTGVTKEEAASIKSALEAAGAEVEVK